MTTPEFHRVSIDLQRQTLAELQSVNRRLMERHPIGSDVVEGAEAILADAVSDQ